MNHVKVLEIKQSVFANNDKQADELRDLLKQKHVFLLNLMSSPGSGKTTTLRQTIALLKDEFKIGVMEADIDSDVDAAAIAATGAKAIQLHTGGMCHLDVSCPSGTERIMAFFTAPVSNSAGQTRFPTFSKMARSTSSVPSPSSPCLVMAASRWHMPPV